MFRNFATTLVKGSSTLRQPCLKICRFNSNNAFNLNSQIAKAAGGETFTIRYTRDHEWIASLPNGNAYIGITKYAADALGDATYIDVPDVGSVVASGEPIGAVESVKSASEIFMPVDGEIVDYNKELVDDPKLLNEDPLGDGWYVQIKVNDVEGLKVNESLLDEAGYENSLSEGEH